MLCALRSMCRLVLHAWAVRAVRALFMDQPIELACVSCPQLLPHVATKCCMCFLCRAGHYDWNSSHSLPPFHSRLQSTSLGGRLSERRRSLRQQACSIHGTPISGICCRSLPAFPPLPLQLDESSPTEGNFPRELACGKEASGVSSDIHDPSRLLDTLGRRRRAVFSVGAFAGPALPLA